MWIYSDSEIEEPKLLYNLFADGRWQALYQLERGWGLLRHAVRIETAGKISRNTWYELLTPDEMAKKVGHLLADAGDPPDQK